MAHDDEKTGDEQGRADQPAVEEDDSGGQERAGAAAPEAGPDEPAPEDSDELGLGDIDPLAWGHADEDDDALVARILGEPPPPPQRIDDRWVLLRRLGRGGMGEVHEAWDLKLNRKVAIKFLHPGHTQDVRAGRQRLAREAEAMAQIPKHPHVVHVYDAGTAGERVFLVMEYVDGSTLLAWQGAARAVGETCAAYLQAGRGLAAIHRAGLVHRDFKPANVFVTGGKAGGLHVTVGDLGLAYATEASAERPPGTDEQSTLHPTIPLTATGAPLGTIQYMAPEQLRGERADARSDQFAFCVSLYEALCGQRPFDAAGSSPAALLDAMGRGMPAARQRSGKPLPARVERVLRRGLSVDPAARFPDMETLLIALTPPPRRTWQWVAAAAVAVMVLPFVWMSMSREPAAAPCEDAAAEQLAGIWDGPVRKALDQRIAAAGGGTPLARAWDALGKALGHQSDAWEREHIAVCAAERRGAPADVGLASYGPRDLCLQRTRLYLTHVTQRWLGENGDIPTHPEWEIFHEAAGLWERPVCSPESVGLMAASQVQTGPMTETRRRQIEKLGELLVHAEQHERRGDYRAAEKSGREAVELAGALGKPLLAEAKYRLGRVLTYLPEHSEEASKLLAEAADLAATHDMSALMVDIAIFWSKHAAVDLKDIPLAQALLRIARYRMLPFDDSDTHTLWRAERAEALGLLASRQGDEDAAIQRHEEALVLRTRIFEAPIAKVLRSKSLNNLANAERAADKADAARRHYEEALALREEVLGPAHPMVGTVLFNLGLLLAEQGEYESAMGYFDRALRIEGALPDGGRTTGLLYRIMAVGYTVIGKYREDRDAGKTEDAHAHFARMQALAGKIVALHRRLEKERPEAMQERRRVYEHVFLGAVYEASRELEAALAAFQAALEIHERTGSAMDCGDDRVKPQDMYRKDLVSAASLLCKLGQPEGARGMLEKALSPPKACEDDNTDEIRASIRREIPRPACRP